VQTGALVFFGFWLFHLCHLFHGLLFPFKAQLLMKSAHFKRYAHAFEVVIVLGCGFIPSIVIVTTSGYRYSGFPPSCSSDNPAVLFYTLILPIALGSTLGLCVLLFSLWILRKVSKKRLALYQHSNPVMLCIFVMDLAIIVLLVRLFY